MKPVRLPENTSMTGFIFDRENENMVSRLTTMTKNRDAIGLLTAWRHTSEFQFVVLAGALHREDGGIVGGMARTSGEAIALYRLAHQRFDELATGSGDFTSAWFLLVREDLRNDFKTVSAGAQQTTGNA